MKKTNFVLCMLLSVMAMLTSCLSNSESEVTLYDDAAITSFTLGTLTQYEPGTDKAVATLTGSNYPMTIDHLNNKIYNSALLPVGTAVNNVVCTVTTMNNGVIQLKDSVNDTFEWFDANYGVDLSREAPRIFRVWASDASFYRDYAVKVNVANSSGDNFTWGAAVADTVLLKGFTDMRLVTLKNKRIVALCGDGAYTYVRFSDDFGTTWDQPQTQEVLADSAWASAVVKDSTLFLLSYGRLSSSADGERWDSSTDADELKQLVATSHGELFALAKDSTMKASADNGISWYDQLADEGLSTDSLKQLLALNDIASTSFDYEFSYHADYVLMAGNNGSNTIVWRKISHYDPLQTADRWSNIPAESTNSYLLPLQERLSLAYFNAALLAFGNGTDVYESQDQGITWNVKSKYAMPEEMLSVTVCDANTLIAIGKSGKVYRGTAY